MNSDKDELKKYLKTSSIESELDKKEIGLELKTNFETLKEGRFPEKLLDEVKNSDTFGNSEIIKEIEENHAKILENRPIPELLDTADLINGLEELKPPAMGKLYEEKKGKNKEKDRFFTEQ
tara:strand:- start:42 stop:404 length:363 start_codon:yes stop_codon:yes gene_type:complete